MNAPKARFASCVNCSGSEMRPAPNGQDILVCIRRGPFPVATPQMVQTPNGAVMGFNLMSLYAPVGQIDWCAQHEFAKDLGKAVQAN